MRVVVLRYGAAKMRTYTFVETEKVCISMSPEGDTAGLWDWLEGRTQRLIDLFCLWPIFMHHVQHEDNRLTIHGNETSCLPALHEEGSQQRVPIASSDLILVDERVHHLLGDRWQTTGVEVKDDGTCVQNNNVRGEKKTSLVARSFWFILQAFWSSKKSLWSTLRIVFFLCVIQFLNILINF